MAFILHSLQVFQGRNWVDKRQCCVLKWGAVFFFFKGGEGVGGEEDKLLFHM